MAPLVLQGATLGERHQYYNNLVKDATSINRLEPSDIDYEKTDIENLFNIDIASKNKNVDYIINVLKGQDMLYVTRAIKRSNWLLNDEEFDHIMDPEFLHSELFPKMLPKAANNFLLHIRINLSNVSRVEKFFYYFKYKNIKTALKWLPKCSLNVIEDTVKEHAREISPKILQRLCKRSSAILDIFAKAHDGYKTNELKAATILLRKNPEKYLDIVSQCHSYEIPTFGKKHTKIVMKKCPQKFVDDFKKFMYQVEVDTFAKYFKKEDIKSFILKQLEIEEVQRWFTQDNITNFIKYMPAEERYDFMKQFIDRTRQIKDGDCVGSCSMSYGGSRATNWSTYRWYKHIPFDIAFMDLKKLIRTESNPAERNSMLMILIGNARKKMSHIQTLVQYYREIHINEPFRFKVQFINDLLQNTDPHLYNEKIWATLEEIFRSMEVYVESDNNVQTCIKSIIAYKVTHDEPVPAIIEHKFNYDSLKYLRQKLNERQKEKVFNYLFKMFLDKLDKKNTCNHAEFAEYVDFLQQGLQLMKDWNKQLNDFPILINKIKECGKIKRENKWGTSLEALYHTKKSWKKYVFENSLVLFPSQIVCMNALKHDPELLLRYKEEVNELCCSDAISMKKVLGKLRVYWPESIANEWASAYRGRLDSPGGYKALIRGLFTLLNHEQLLDFVKQYEPKEAKIDWANADEHELALRKHIAQNMHIARPQLTPEVVLWYATGDYVQFTQPSLNAILYNIKSSDYQMYIHKLLAGITSLQKHGIHLAFAKLQTADASQIFADIWKSNKNSSVRAALFRYVHQLLCKEQDESLIAELWELMQIFIDSLTAEENKTVYNTFGHINKVHFRIKPAYCMKGYKFLKSLPPKADCKNIFQKMKEEMNNIIEELDSDFIADIILEFVDQSLLKKSYGYGKRHDMSLLISYILGADSENVQLQRYGKVFVPLMEKMISSWAETKNNEYYVRENFERVMKHMYQCTVDFAFMRNKVKPTALFRNILTKLNTLLPAAQNYDVFTQLKLAIMLVTVLENTKTDPGPVLNGSEMQKLFAASASDLGDELIRTLKEEIELYTEFVYRPFADALKSLFSSFYVDYSSKLKFIRKLSSEKDNIPLYLIITDLLDYYYEDSLETEVNHVHQIVKRHPSPEIQIRYYKEFGDKCFTGKKLDCIKD